MTGGAGPNDFDPYWEWLRIPHQRRPPSYYDLLGVGIDETDDDEIRQAAAARYTRVHANSLGPQAQIATRVLEELARAVHCLTDSELREDYRRQLQREGRWPGDRAGGPPAKSPPPELPGASPAGGRQVPQPPVVPPPFPPAGQPTGLPEPAGAVTLRRINWEEKPPSVGQKVGEAIREFDVLLAAVAREKDGPRHNLLRALVVVAPLLLLIWVFMPRSPDPSLSATLDQARDTATEAAPTDTNDAGQPPEDAGEAAKPPPFDDATDDATESPPSGDATELSGSTSQSVATLRATIRAHSAAVSCLAFSPDGSILASAGNDATTCLLDPATGRVRRTISASPGTRWLAFSPDGSKLLSNCGAWSVATGQPQQFLWPSEVRQASASLLSPEGSLLATIRKGAVRIRDPSTGQARRMLHVTGDTIRCLAFSSDASMLAFAGSRRLVFWNTVDNKSEHVVGDVGAPIRCLAFSPDGSILASGSDDRTVRLWAAGAGQAVLVLDDHAGAVESVAFHPDGSMLASGSSDGTVKLWNPAAGSLIETLEGHREPVHSVAFKPTGSLLASAGADGAVRLWEFGREAPRSADPGMAPWEEPEFPNLDSEEAEDAPLAGSTTSPRLRRTLEGHPFGTDLLAFSADGTTLVSVGGGMKVWDVATGILRTTIDVGSRAAVAGPDGTILTTNWAGRGTLRDMATGEAREELASFSWSVRALSPDGLLAATADDYGRNVRLVDAHTGETRHRVQVPVGEQVEAVALSPHGSLLATGSYRYVRLWSARTGLLEAEFKQDSGAKSIAFSPNGKALACGTSSGPVYVWDVRRERLRATLEGHDRWVECCVFSPDGATLATAGHDNTVRLWDMAAAQPLATLEGHRDWVTALAFSPDGTIFASSSRDETIRLWQIAAPGD